MHRVFESKRGYTLLELLVGISIMAIITTLAIAYSSERNEELAFRSNVENFITEIERVKNNALNGDFGSATNPQPESHGIRIPATGAPPLPVNTYRVFVDQNNYRFDMSDNIFNDVTLPTDMQITMLNDCAGSSYLPPFDISFELFTGIFYVEGAVASADVCIVLHDISLNRDATIKINPLGLILPN